ncbi:MULTISPECIES: hypothetical protein [unclassified Bradyrhizobium]|jgi:hypothetical protein|uniref:hypothetical protein n=1 Tax=unclassified Bradyrhizobium TaxID=2631580 RepID=UPI003398FA9D
MGLKASPILPWSRTLSDGDCPFGSGYPAKKCCWLTFNRWRKQSSQLTQRAETGVSNEKCYLHPLGGCSTKITREHFLSRNILQRLAEGKLLRLQNAGHLFGGKDRGVPAKRNCNRFAEPAASVVKLDDAIGCRLTTTMIEELKRKNLRSTSSAAVSVSAMKPWPVFGVV